MALTITVTKKSVTGTQPKINMVTFNLAVVDTAGDGINQDFSIEYRAGDNIANKTATIISDMQTAIDSYKARQLILNSTALTNAVTTIQNGLSA